MFGSIPIVGQADNLAVLETGMSFFQILRNKKTSCGIFGAQIRYF